MNKKVSAVADRGGRTLSGESTYRESSARLEGGGNERHSPWDSCASGYW